MTATDIEKTATGSAGPAANAPAAVPGGDTPKGFALAFLTYFLWGFLPLYMKAVAHIPATEVVAHRILWSVPIAGIVLLVMGRTSDIRAALRSPRTLAMAALTAVLITLNWGIYVWAIGNGRALETALGYYINPLFSIFLAAMLLGEKPRPLQWAAIGLAAAAVALLTWETGGLPWVSVALCVTWGFYAFFKRTLPVGPSQGFFLEVLLLCLPAIGYIMWLQMNGVGHFGGTGILDVGLLLGCGIVTAVPLILYANAAKLLTLSTIGIMQYIAPTMIFLTAVFIFREPFSSERFAAFGLIWAALILYSWSMLSAHRKH